MFDDAIAELQKAITLSGSSPLMIAALGHAYAKAGQDKSDCPNQTRLDTLGSLVIRFDSSILPAAWIDDNRYTAAVCRCFLVLTCAERLEARIVHLEFLRQILPHYHRPRLRKLKVLFLGSLRTCLSGDDREAIRVVFEKGPDLIQRLLFEFGGIGT